MNDKVCCIRSLSRSSNQKSQPKCAVLPKNHNRSGEHRANTPQQSSKQQVIVNLTRHSSQPNTRLPSQPRPKNDQVFLIQRKPQSAERPSSACQTPSTRHWQVTSRNKDNSVPSRKKEPTIIATNTSYQNSTRPTQLNTFAGSGTGSYAGSQTNQDSKNKKIFGVNSSQSMKQHKKSNDSQNASFSSTQHRASKPVKPATNNQDLQNLINNVTSA